MPRKKNALANGSQGDGSAKKRVRKGFPPFDLEHALPVAEAIAEQNAGKPYSRLSLAEAIGRKPDSSAFRELLSAANQYGLTEGSKHTTTVSLTPLGMQVVMQKSESERKHGLLQAARSITIFAELYTKFDQAKLPSDLNFKNTLIREHGVDAAAADQCIANFKADARFVGLIRNVAGSERVDIPFAEAAAASDESTLDQLPAIVEPDADVAEVSGASNVSRPGSAAASHPPAIAPSAIFIGHGHDLDALKSLENLLKQMGVEYVIAKDEAHAGRPITQKVADEMRRCSAGIFIASADDDGLDAKGNSVKRARQNVVYELGAASLLYGQRIVIFKESGVEFPTDFADLGYISYERGHLAEKFADLIRELVKLNAIKISAGG